MYVGGKDVGYLSAARHSSLADAQTTHGILGFLKKGNT